MLTKQPDVTIGEEFGPDRPIGVDKGELNRAELKAAQLVRVAGEVGGVDELDALEGMVGEQLVLQGFPVPGFIGGWVLDEDLVGTQSSSGSDPGVSVGGAGEEGEVT